MTIQRSLSELLLNGGDFVLALPSGDHYDCQVDGLDAGDGTLRFAIFDGEDHTHGEIAIETGAALLIPTDRDDSPERYVVVAIHPSGGGDRVLRLAHPDHA